MGSEMCIRDRINASKELFNFDPFSTQTAAGVPIITSLNVGDAGLYPAKLTGVVTSTTSTGFSVNTDLRGILLPGDIIMIETNRGNIFPIQSISSTEIIVESSFQTIIGGINILPADIHTGGTLIIDVNNVAPNPAVVTPVSVPFYVNRNNGSIDTFLTQSTSTTIQSTNLDSLGFYPGGGAVRLFHPSLSGGETGIAFDYKGVVVFKENLIVNRNTRSSTDVALDVSGSIFASSFLELSDERMKSQIKEIPYTIQDLQPKTYINTLTNSLDHGFLAHEVQDVIPILVNGEKDGPDYQSINYNGIIALLVKEIKELKKRIERVNASKKQ